MTQTATFEEIVTRARRTTGMTPAEFDYSLQASDDHRADDALRGAACAIATPEPADDMSAVEYVQHGEALLNQYQGELAELYRRAKDREYTGWSAASRAMGHPIEYANES